MPIQPNIVQCTHIKLKGYRCGSPALTGQRLCYFHARMRRGTKARLDAAIPPLLLLEDAESIQGALMQIIDLLLYDQIELKKARLVLRAIEIASHNVKNLRLQRIHLLDDESPFDKFEGDMVRDLPEEAPPDAAEGDPDSEDTDASPLPDPVLPSPGEHRVTAGAAPTHPAAQNAAPCPKKPAASAAPPTREDLRKRLERMERPQASGPGG